MTLRVILVHAKWTKIIWKNNQNAIKCNMYPFATITFHQATATFWYPRQGHFNYRSVGTARKRPLPLSLDSDQAFKACVGKMNGGSVGYLQQLL